MHASYYSASLLACWMRFILLPSHRQKTLTFTCQFQTGEEDKGEQMSEAVGEKSCDVIAGGCHHYASGALNCCTDRRNRMNILTQTNEGGKKRDLPGIELASHVPPISECEWMLGSLGRARLIARGRKLAPLGSQMKHITQHSRASLRLTINNQAGCLKRGPEASTDKLACRHKTPTAIYNAHHKGAPTN